MLATVTHDHPGDWEQHIRKVCLAYNSSVHSATGFSPFLLMFGREAKLPVDLMYGSNRIEERRATEYAHNRREGLQSSYALVREHCKAEHRRQGHIRREGPRETLRPWRAGMATFTSCPARSVKKTASPMEGPIESPRAQGRLCIQDCKA